MLKEYNEMKEKNQKNLKTVCNILYTNNGVSEELNKIE